MRSQPGRQRPLHVVGGFLLFGIGVFAAAAAVHAGEPLVTDDASVIDPRRTQVIVKGRYAVSRFGEAKLAFGEASSAIGS